MTEASVLCAVADGVATITLNRPDKLNAFNEAMHGELARLLDRIEADPAVRALLLTGAGRAFCAGQDLGDRVMGEGDAPPDLGDTLERLYNPLVRRLRGLERPVVCAVNGVAAGAGANLALGCDIVLAARSAKFIQAFCKLGLVPDSGGTYLLPRLVGHARAMGLALLGEPLSAEQAAAWGLIWRVVDDAQLMRRGDRARPPSRAPADQGPGADQTGTGRVLRQHPRPAARPRARPAARGRPDRGLWRGRAGVPREAPAGVQGPLRWRWGSGRE